MLVSFIIIALNEEKNLKNLLEDLNGQTYPKKLIEVILIDSISSDNTKNVMNEFRNSNKEFNKIIIKSNVKKILPCGWNIAISESKGDILLRVDAHSRIPKNFIEENVNCIKSGEKICGGYRENIILNKNHWKETLLLAEKSIFGSSIAPYRRNLSKRYVSSIFHGAYSREVFENTGLFNENLSRTEDNEMNYRIRKNGYKICFNPNIKSYQYTRNDLLKMLKQKFLNGYWIGLTLGVCPKCISIYHLIPFLFVLALAFTTINIFLNSYGLFIILGMLYSFLILINTLFIIKNNEFNIFYIFLPIIFLILHLSYGIGTFIGIIKLPFFKIKVYKGRKINEQN